MFSAESESVSVAVFLFFCNEENTTHSYESFCATSTAVLSQSSAMCTSSSHLSRKLTVREQLGREGEVEIGLRRGEDAEEVAAEGETEEEAEAARDWEECFRQLFMTS